MKNGVPATTLAMCDASGLSRRAMPKSGVVVGFTLIPKDHSRQGVRGT
jgi:hypothetical protein